MRCRKILLVLLVFGGLRVLSANEILCKDVKKKGYKVTCPFWDGQDCRDCEWFEMERCNGDCGGGRSIESRSRTCSYFDVENNLKDQKCYDHQDRHVKCVMDCGYHGKYDIILDKCDCNANFAGTCCEIDHVDIVCNLKPGEVSSHRDPKNCGLYYVCEGDIKHHMPCPGGLAFSEEKGKCLDPKEVPGC